MIRRYGVNQFKFDGTGNAASTFPGSRVRQRFRRGDSPDRRAARREAGSLRESHDRHVSVAVLAALGRLDLARRRRSRLRRRRLEPAAVDHLSRCRHVRRTSCARAALPAQLADAARADLRAVGATNLNTDPGDDFASRCTRTSATGRSCRRCTSRRRCSRRENWDAIAEAREMVARATRTRSSTRTGSAAIRCGSSPTAGRRGRRARGISRCGTRATSRSRSRSTSQQAFELPSDAPARYRMHSPFDTAMAPADLRAGQPHTFDLRPFEVLTLESDPVSRVR